MSDEKQGSGGALDPDDQPIPYALTPAGWTYEPPKKRARPEKAPRRREVRA